MQHFSADPTSYIIGVSGNKVCFSKHQQYVCIFQLVTLYCSWFDVFNSRRRYHKSKQAASAYGGEYLELQNKILKEFSEAIKNLLCDGHDKMIDFQHGIVVTSAALPQMYDELYLEYQVGIYISSVVEVQRCWVLKSKLFAQESTCSMEILIPTTLKHL